MDVSVTELQDLIRRTVTRHGHGRWRLSENQVDHAHDLVVEHVLPDTAANDRDHLEAWLTTICLDFAQREPSRVEFDRRTVFAITKALPMSAAVRVLPCHHLQPSAALLDVAPGVLTPAEQRVLSAMLTHATIATAAVATAMSHRDLRVRCDRIAVKLRSALARAATSSNAHHAAFPHRS